MAKQLLSKLIIDTNKIDSIIFISEEKFLFKSDAALEIAKLLNISEGTSKSNLSRARKILKNKLEMLKNKQN